VFCSAICVFSSAICVFCTAIFVFCSAIFVFCTANTKIAELNTQIAGLTTRVEYQRYVIAIQDINHLHHLESKVDNLHKLRRKQRVEISHFIDDNDGLNLQNYKASFALTQFNKMSPPCQDKFKTRFGPNFLTQFSNEVKNIGLVVGFVSDDDVAETAEWWDE
jgi:hypothetical protein